MTFIFHRAEGWYPVDLASEAVAVEHAVSNPGTKRVETVDGKIIFPLPCHNN